jgi:hypothetical protein
MADLYATAEAAARAARGSFVAYRRLVRPTMLWAGLSHMSKEFEEEVFAPHRSVNGRPRQFCVMWQNSRCSILFHFDVPGG